MIEKVDKVRQRSTLDGHKTRTRLYRTFSINGATEAEDQRRSTISPLSDSIEELAQGTVHSMNCKDTIDDRMEAEALQRCYLEHAAFCQSQVSERCPVL